MDIVWHFVILSLISYGAAVSLRKQLEHVKRRRLENQNYGIIARRFFGDPMAPTGSLLGVPSMPSHLPEAEPILPGHTLLRPALGMLKSAVKFPHREMENGAGVYGNIDNLGIRYDGLNERVLYTGFRRIPSEYVLMLPQSSKNGGKPTFLLGAPLSIRSDHFYTEPQDDNEINVNRLETQRAIEEFFRKARESRQYSQKLRKSTGLLKSKSQDTPKKMQKNVARILEADTSTSDEEHPTLNDLVSEFPSSAEDKKTWFSKSKDMFTHININGDAPEHLDFLPLTEEDMEKIRSWWYYNQDDFEVFDERELSKLVTHQENDKEPE